MDRGSKILQLFLIFIFVTCIVYVLNSQFRDNYRSYNYFNFKLSALSDICAISAPILYIIFIAYSETTQNSDEPIEKFKDRKLKNDNIANICYWISIVSIILAYLFMVLGFKYII